MSTHLSHMAWADSVVWQAVLASPKAHQDKNLKERLSHIHMVQHAFLGLWRKTAPATDSNAKHSMREILIYGRSFHEEASTYWDTLSAPDLKQSVDVPWASEYTDPKGTEAVKPNLGETLLHLCGHTTHHRGQIAARLREIGGEHPITDFIVLIWRGRQDAVWPAESVIQDNPHSR